MAPVFMHNSASGGHILPVRPSLRALIDLSARPAEPDAALVRLFASTGDPAAFAELVRRYGRLVWGQCKNLLASEADADDAFQATFLTLAKSARGIREAHKLGPWLHGVAYRVCQNSKRKSARRAKREKATAKAEATKPVADSAWDSAFAAVHDELATLPDALRVPFVLCVLEGKGTTEAAAQLGLKVGTFSARLSRAKQALFDRLNTRGLTTGLAVVGAVAVGASSVPAAVAGRACDLAAGGAVAPNILSLTHGVLNMAATTLKRWAMAAVLATAAAVCVGGVMTASADDKAVDKAKDDLKKLQEKLGPDVSTFGEAEDRLNKLHDEADAILKAAELTEREAQRKRLVREKLAEFKYDVKGAEYAPTSTEFEKAVKDGEADGYTFVAVVTFAGFTEKKGKGPVQALVFRRAAGPLVTADPGLDAIKERRLAKDLAEAADRMRTDRVTEQERLLQAQIEKLTKELVELRAKGGDRPSERMNAVFALADFGGDADAATALLTALARAKYGVEVAKKVQVEHRNDTVYVTGLTKEQLEWLIEAVKGLKPPKPLGR